MLEAFITTEFLTKLIKIVKNEDLNFCYNFVKIFISKKVLHKLGCKGMAFDALTLKK